MKIMKLRKQVLRVLGCPAALLCAASLSDVHTVYFLPMSHGLDQYLANRLASEHLFRVVTDPKLADAIWTERIGEHFQAKMDDLLPNPGPSKQASAEESEDEEDSASPPKMANKLPALTSSFGGGRGTVFLVDAKSRQVLWSVYDRPKNFDSAQLDHTASGIVSRLKKDLGRK